MLRKELLTTVFVFTCSLCFAQEQLYKIIGTIQGPIKYEYAYMYSESSKKLNKAKIQNRQFAFLGKENVDEKMFNSAFIFLSNDSSDRYIDQQEILKKKIDRQYRILIIEDTPISIAIDGDVKNAKVVGGRLNKDLDDMYQAISESKYEDFIIKHADSPISLMLIKAILPVMKISRFDLGVNCQALYDELSDRIKYSAYGLETLEKIKKQ